MHGHPPHFQCHSLILRVLAPVVSCHVGFGFGFPTCSLTFGLFLVGCLLSVDVSFGNTLPSVHFHCKNCICPLRLCTFAADASARISGIVVVAVSHLSPCGTCFSDVIVFLFRLPLPHTSGPLPVGDRHDSLYADPGGAFEELRLEVVAIISSIIRSSNSPAPNLHRLPLRRTLLTNSSVLSLSVC